MSITPSRRRTRLLLGAAAGLALALGAPVAASAHIHVTPDAAAADAATTLTFSFSHGCDDSPTTAITVDMPEGVTNVVPIAAAGWGIQRDFAANGTVTRVVYTAAVPIESGLKGEVAMEVRFPAEAADTAVAFPVTQDCVAGSTAWTQVAADGEDEPESPAPTVAVGAVAAEGAGHGGGREESSASDESVDDGADTAAADGTGAPVQTVAVWLGGAGLAVGAAALVVAVAALRRRRG